MRKLFSVFSIIALVVQLHAGDTAAMIQPGEKVIGARLALGSVYGASAGVILSGEYGFKENFLDIGDMKNNLGFGASLGYSGYSETYPFVNGEYTYRNILFLGTALWHVAVLADLPVDTYFSISFGWNIVSSSVPAGGKSYDSSYGGFVWGTGLGARYYFNDKLAAVGEVGIGMGILRVGIDYSL